MNTNIIKVLAIEDDPVIRNTLTRIFDRDGRVTLSFAVDGQQGFDLLYNGNFDLAIVDLGLPKKSGRQIIKEARDSGLTLPILVLTANNETGSEADNINGGANDYVTKPFDHNVLVSRVMRRVHDSVANANPIIAFDGLSFDTFRDKISGDGFESFKLDRKPARVLETLLRSKSRILEPETLIREVWELVQHVGAKTLTKTVSRLNREFESRGLGRIVTFVTGMGYELVRK